MESCPKCLRTQIVDIGWCSCGHNLRPESPARARRRTRSATERPESVEVAEVGTDPAPFTYGFLAVVVGLGLLVFLIVAFRASLKDSWYGQQDKTTTQQQQGTETQRCLRDIECVEQQHQWRDSADLMCRAQIDANAIYGTYWLSDNNPRMFGMFNNVRLNPPNYDTVVYSGSNVRYRTADGRSDPMYYECFYDPIKRTVVGLSI